jgi:hypothetical protein
MMMKLVILTTGLSCALITSAFAMPRGRSSESIVTPVRTVCDQSGRCYEQENPGEGIARGIVRGLEGRGGDRDYDRDRGYRRDGDRDREYRRRERDDDD